MLLTEYDERQHMETVYREGYEKGEQAGYSEGEQGMLERLVRNKLECGKSTAEIAEELGIEVALSEEIVSKISRKSV